MAHFFFINPEFETVGAGIWKKKLNLGTPNRHAVEENGGLTPRYRFQVRDHFNDPLYRQLEEGARIEYSMEESLINTKSEWAPPLLSRMTIN